MDWYAIVGIIVVAAAAVIYALCVKYYNYVRSDAGYNVGRNHMMDEYGFDDEDIRKGKDDDDEDMYVFRKKNKPDKKAD